MTLRNRPLEMGLKPVTGLADGVDDKDAVNVSQLNGAVSTVQDAIDALEIPAFNQTDFISGLIPGVLDQDYRIIVNAPYVMTINSVTTRSTSGTCTATFKINSTALGGTANSVSTTEQTQAHTTANAVAAGDDVVLTISANATCLNTSFTIAFTRVLA